MHTKVMDLSVDISKEKGRGAIIGSKRQLSCLSTMSQKIRILTAFEGILSSQVDCDS